MSATELMLRPLRPRGKIWIDNGPGGDHIAGPGMSHVWVHPVHCWQVISTIEKIPEDDQEGPAFHLAIVRSHTKMLHRMSGKECKLCLADFKLTEHKEDWDEIDLPRKDVQRLDIKTRYFWRLIEPHDFEAIHRGGRSLG